MVNSKANIRNKLTPIKNIISLIDNNILVLNDAKYKDILYNLIKESKESISILTK